MSPWFFNIFFDRVVRQVNDRVMVRGANLRDEKGGGCEIKHVLYTSDTVLVAEIRKHLHHIVSEFERACDNMGLKINVGKRKVLMVKQDQMGSCEKVRVSGEEMEEVGKFNYLGVMIITNGGMGNDVVG